MGKAKRFNSYDSSVAEQRKLVQSYGQARQNLSGVTSTFRNPALTPIATIGSGDSSPLTTKGDLYTFDTANQRLGVGTNGQVLTADSTEATGLKWAAGGAGNSIQLNVFADVLSVIGTEYLGFGEFGASSFGAELNHQSVVPVARTLKTIYLHFLASSTITSGSFDITIRRNGADLSPNKTINVSAVTGPHIISDIDQLYSAGDLLTIEFTPVGSPVATLTLTSMAAEWGGSGLGSSIQLNVFADTVSNGATEYLGFGEFAGGSLGAEGNRQSIVPIDSTLTTLYLHFLASSTITSGSFDVTVRRNGADLSPTKTINVSTVAGPHVISNIDQLYSAGDLLTVEFAPVGTPVSSLTLTSMGAEWNGGTGSVSFPLNYPVDRQGNKSGTVTHDLDATTGHKLEFTATGDCDITISNIPTSSADAMDFYIEVVQDGTGLHAITFNDAEWDPVPSFGTAADSVSLISVHADGDGKLRPVILLNATISTGKLSDLIIDTDFDANGVRKYILDADADTYLIGDTDDRIEFFTAGTEKLRITTEVQLQGSVNLDLNGNDLVFGTGAGEFMDHGASSNIRVNVGSALKASFDATGLLLASGYRLTVEDEARFVAITKPGANTQGKIYTENLANDDLVLNAPTAGDVRVDIAGVEAVSFSSASTQFGNLTLSYALDFLRNDPSPMAADEIARFNFTGNDDGAGADIYARMAVIQTSVAAGSEDGDMQFSVLQSGSLTETMNLDGSTGRVNFPNGDVGFGSNDLIDVGSVNISSPTTISGARDDPEQALKDLLTDLASIGLITDSTTAS